MDNNINFKNIWQQQKVNPPDMDDLHTKVKQYKRASLRKQIFYNVVLAATFGFIIFIWIYYQPQFISTKIGIILIVMAMVIYLFSYNSMLSILNKIDNTQTNSKYLQSLRTLNTKQKYLQTTIMSLYFIMLSIGICLVMYESASKMTVFWASVTYICTLNWIGFNWFYIRPRTIKKQQAKLDELLHKFEAINQQLK